ncbi:MAG: hypothetical protein C0609_02840 [Deltaproteobacteria bacterium]|nr:MAG: hypothetical protein C0609_02840 [Deltaproteobacteria bacterium]
MPFAIGQTNCFIPPAVKGIIIDEVVLAGVGGYQRTRLGKREGGDILQLIPAAGTAVTYYLFKYVLRSVGAICRGSR